MTETIEAPVEARAASPETPYVGLVPFAESDAPFFFGRQRQRRLIAANLIASRLTLFYGASGVGKSSVLRAGVAHDLMEVARRERANGRTPEAILVVFAEWRDPPLPLLAQAIEAAVRSTLGELAPAPPPPAEHFDELLAEWVKRIDAVQASGDGERRTRLLIVLDQFEEYFLYHWHGDEDEGGLGVELPRAVNREGLRANFAISIREDAYAQLDRFKGSIPNLFESSLRIRHLDQDAASRAIRSPVETWNEQLPDGAMPYTIEDELVEQVLDDVRIGSVVLGQSGAGSVGESGERRIEAPFLQLVMRRLWCATVDAGEHALTLARLRALGGAESIVRAHLNDALSELQPTQRDLAARLFHQLVTPEGAKIAHTVGALGSYAKVEPDELLPMLKALSDGRILRPVDPPPGQTTPRYEIYHDVLAAPILEWRTEHVRAKQERERLSDERHRQRTRMLVGLTVALSLGLLVAVALSAWAIDQRNDAIAQTELARSQELANTARAQIGVDPELAVLLALEAVEAEPTEQAQDALRAALAASHVRTVLPHRGPVTDASYSSDASSLLTAASDGTARLWSATGQRQRVFRAPGGVPEAAMDVRGTRVAAAAGDGGARLWDARTGQSINLSGGRLVAASVAFSPDGRLVAVAGGDPGRPRSFEVRVWRAADGVPVQIFRGHTRFIYHVEFSPDGRRLVSASRDATARIWTLGRPDAVVIRHELSVNDARFSPDGSSVATAGWDGIVRVVGITGEPRRELRVGRGRLYSVAFGPRAGTLAAASADWTVQYWTAGRTSVLRGHTGAVSQVAFSSRGDLLSASADGTARVWDVSTGEARAVLRGHAGPVASAAFSPDGRRVVTTSSDRTARIWDVAHEPLVAELRPAGPGGPPSFSASGYGVRFSDDGRSLLVRSGFDRPRLYNASGKLQAALPRRGGTTTSGAFNPEGTLVATATAAGPVQIWEVPGGRLVRSLRGHTPRPVVPGGVPYIIRRVEFSPDGSTLLTAGYDGTARIWEVSTWRTLHVLGAPGSRGFLEAATFSRDGKLVATAGFGNQPVRIWNARDGTLVRSLGSAQTGLHCASFGPDSTVLASCGADGVARLWDVAGGRLLLALRGHAGAVLSAVFSPNGELVATTGQDRTARIWDAASGAPVGVVSDVGGYPAVFAANGSLVAAGSSIVLARTGDRIADVGRVGEPLVSAASPDGRLAATVGYGGLGGLVRCSLCESLPELVVLARTRVTRALTPQERARFVS